MLRGLLLLLAILFTPAAFAQEAEPKPALDMREVVAEVPVTATDVLSGKTQTKPMKMTIYRPKGDGRFPLIILNHGRSKQPGNVTTQPRPRYEMQARYFTQRGFVVIIPFRLGYDVIDPKFDPENTGFCNNGAVKPLADVMVKQILAARDYAKTLPYVDASRWVVAGQSYGGFAVLATLKAQPDGLVGALNFAGGIGGDNVRSPEKPCGLGRKMGDFIASHSKQVAIPNVWFYWRNDTFWGARIPNQWFVRWKKEGNFGEFHQFSQILTEDGHYGISYAMDDWVPKADAFFDTIGFRKPAAPLEENSSPVLVDDLARVPISEDLRIRFYKKFLEAKTPRAFAISPTGAVGWATGDWAKGKALGFCERLKGEICTLYAVDNSVIWPKK